MKKYFFILVLLASTAQAQSLGCPKLSGKAKLTGASTFFDKTSEIQGDRTDVKNGYNLRLPLNIAYLVCEYENGVKNWKNFKPKEDIETCNLQVKEYKKEVKSIILTCF